MIIFPMGYDQIYHFPHGWLVRIIIYTIFWHSNFWGHLRCQDSCMVQFGEKNINKMFQPSDFLQLVVGIFQAQLFQFGRHGMSWRTAIGNNKAEVGKLWAFWGTDCWFGLWLALACLHHCIPSQWNFLGLSWTGSPGSNRCSILGMYCCELLWYYYHILSHIITYYHILSHKNFQRSGRWVSRIPFYDCVSFCTHSYWSWKYLWRGVDRSGTAPGLSGDPPPVASHASHPAVALFEQLCETSSIESMPMHKAWRISFLQKPTTSWTSSESSMNFHGLVHLKS